MSFDFDFVIVGSGFGGSVSALRLVEKGCSSRTSHSAVRTRPTPASASCTARVGLEDLTIEGSVTISFFVPRWNIHSAEPTTIA